VSASSAAALTRRWNRLKRCPWARSSENASRHGPVFGITLASVQLVLDTASCIGIVWLASRARRWLSRAAIRRRLERILGATLVALGIDRAASR
jgi:threonine/homoserine/homoserine lactone efflux protein